MAWGNAAGWTARRPAGRIFARLLDIFNRNCAQDRYNGGLTHDSRYSMRFRWPLFSVLILAWLGAPAAASVLRVPEDHARIQAAIDAAAPGDTIVVAPGEYRENLDFLGKQITLQSSDGPTVTVIDGSDGGSVISFGPSGGSGTVTGFTLRGGTGTPIAANRVGGGVLCLGGSPTIEGNIIRACTAQSGGAIAALGSSTPDILRNRIRDNWVSSFGGGIYCDETANVTITDNKIKRNIGFSGLAIAVIGDATAYIEGNHIHQNLPDESLAGVLLAWNVDDVQIIANTFDGQGGDAMQISHCNDVRVEGNRVSGLYLSVGLYAESCERLQLIGNSFTEQRLSMISCTDTRSTRDRFVGSTLLLIGNPSIRVDSSAFLDSGTALEWPGITCIASRLDLVNTTYLWSGGGISMQSASEVEVVNSIVWGNEPAFVDDATATLGVSHSVVTAGWPGDGNLDLDPGIVDGDGGDGGEIHLRLGSPCIDAGKPIVGDNDEDIDGDPRIVGPQVDIGADEFRLEIAARYGNVGQTGERVLTVNGSSGDHRRSLRLTIDEPLSINLAPGSAGPDPAHFAIYAWLDEPDAATIRLQPFGLGWMGFATALQPGDPNQPIAVWNTLGRPTKLGHATRPSGPAPTTLEHLAAGIAIPIRFTVQGFLEDLGSGARGPVSITNAVVVDIATR